MSYIPDHPTEEELRPAQGQLLTILSDLKPRTVEEICAMPQFEGTKRGTVHELIRICREKGYDIVSPAKKMTVPYTFRLKSVTPGAPRSQDRCPCCDQKYRRINTLRGDKDYIDDKAPIDDDDIEDLM